MTLNSRKKFTNKQKRTKNKNKQKTKKNNKQTTPACCSQIIVADTSNVDRKMTKLKLIYSSQNLILEEHRIEVFCYHNSI